MNPMEIVILVSIGVGGWVLFLMIITEIDK
jgi:hypothetical protein